MDAILERDVKTAEKTKEASREREEAVRAREFNKNISQNYEKLIGGRAQSTVAYAEPVSERTVEVEPATRREEKPVEFAAPKEAHPLFDGMYFKDGELYSQDTATMEPEVEEKEEEYIAPAPAAATFEEAYQMAASAAHPVQAPDAEEEDALPTRRTLDSIRHDAFTETVENAKLSSYLSSKAKVILMALALVVVAAIVVIAVCTSVINSMGAELARLQAQFTELQSAEAEISAQIRQVTSIESIVEYAQRMGMILAK